MTCADILEEIADLLPDAEITTEAIGCPGSSLPGVRAVARWREDHWDRTLLTMPYESETVALETLKRMVERYLQRRGAA